MDSTHTEVMCTGVPSLKFPYTPAGQNEYKNPYGSEYAMFKCGDGASARMLVAWDNPGYGADRFFTAYLQFDAGLFSDRAK